MDRTDLPVHPQSAPRLGNFAGLPVREDTLFSNHKGVEKSAIRRTAQAILNDLCEPLSRMLEPGEVIFYATPALSPAGLLDQFSFGMYIYDVAACVLVFTNRRMLAFRIRRRIFRSTGPWKNSVRAVRWSDVAAVQVKPGPFGRCFTLRYRDGSREKYWRVKSPHALKVLLPMLLSAGAAQGSHTGAAAQLCPECFRPLTPGRFQCDGCLLQFKDERTMKKRSLLIPGGGYFYTGHPIFGTLDFIVEGYLLILLLISLALLFLPSEEPVGLAETMPVLIGVGILLALEKAITIHHCQRFIRDYLPLPRTGAAAQPAQAGK